MADEDAVARQLADTLNTAGVPAVLKGPSVSWAYGRNVLVGPVRKATDAGAGAHPVPNRCIFVIGSGGVDDEPFNDGGGRTGIRRPSVQIRIRGGRGTYTEDKELADAVWQAADKRPPPGYQEARALASAPLFLGLDLEQHPEWTVNLLLWQQV